MKLQKSSESRLNVRERLFTGWMPAVLLGVGKNHMVTLKLLFSPDETSKQQHQQLI